MVVLTSARRGLWLLLLLAAVAITLAVFARDISLSYRTAAVRRTLRRGHVDAAIVLLEQPAHRDEGSAEWHYLLACARRRHGDLSVAKEHLAQAEKFGWDAQDVRREDLLIQARDGRIKELEPQLAELLQASQNDEVAEELYEAMAQCYLASFFVEDASNCLKYWSEWQPANLLPRLWMADLDERIENPNAAIAEYRKILEIDPKNTEVLTKLGALLLGKLEVEEAADIFSRCLAEAPETPEALLGLAECRRRQTSSDEAKELLYEALLLELSQSQESKAKSGLGKMAIDDRDYGRAIPLLRQSVALNPNDASSRVALARALAAMGQEELAAVERERARKIVARHARLTHILRETVTAPANPDLRCEAGLILIEQGFASAGAGWLRTAIQVAPAHRAAHEGLANYYESMGQLDQARQHRQAAGQEPLPTALPAEHRGG